MTRNFVLVALSLLMLTLAVAGTASAATNYEQKAIVAARQAGCINGQKPQELYVNVQTSGICFVSGELHTASVLWAPPSNCPVGSYCPTPAPVVIASVEFGCNDEITSVRCY